MLQHPEQHPNHTPRAFPALLLSRTFPASKRRCRDARRTRGRWGSSAAIPAPASRRCAPLVPVASCLRTGIWEFRAPGAELEPGQCLPCETVPAPGTLPLPAWLLARHVKSSASPSHGEAPLGTLQPAPGAGLGQQQGDRAAWGAGTAWQSCLRRRAEQLRLSRGDSSVQMCRSGREQPCHGRAKRPLL